MNKKFFLRFLSSSVMKRLPKTLSCILVLSLSSTLVFYALNFQRYGSKDVEKKLRGIGPNMLVLPGQTGFPYLDKEHVRIILRALQLNGAVNSSAFLYKIGSVEEKQVVVSGAELSRMKNIFPYMREESKWLRPRQNSKKSTSVAWVGSRAADVLSLRAGEPFTLEFTEDGKKISRRFVPEIVFATGDAEEDKIFVELKTLQDILRADGNVSLIAASLPSSASLFPEDFKKGIENKLQGIVQVKLLHAIAQTQVSFVQSVSRFLWVVSWILLILTAMGISSTFMSVVYERMQEMALLKTLGAGRKDLLVFFLTESALIGAAGGALGLALGIGSLSFVFKRVLEMPVAVVDAGLFGTMAVSFLCAVCVTILGSVFPLLKVVRISPTAALKGE